MRIDPEHQGPKSFGSAHDDDGRFVYPTPVTTSHVDFLNKGQCWGLIGMMELTTSHVICRTKVKAGS